MTKYASLAVAVDGYLEKRAAGLIGRGIGTGFTALNAAVGRSMDVNSSHLYDPVAQKPWYRTGEGLANIGDWTIGFVPGVGSLWSLGRAGWSALNGNWGEAGLHLLGAVPLAGRGLSAAAKASRAAVAAGRAGLLARGTARAANAAAAIGGSAAKIPLAGTLVRSPGVRDAAWMMAKDKMVQDAHTIGSNRRGDAAQQAYQSQQQQQPQQTNRRPVAPVHGATF